MRRTTVEWLVHGLRERGVDWISALCGHGLDPLFDACRRGGIRIVDVRNEQTAGYMADYWGRLTRRPGVCASSSGVAVANLLTGAMNAWFDGAPMLAISGSADLPTLGSGSFQDSPQVELAEPVTTISRRLDQPTRVLELLARAWPTRGPAHIMIPMDVQRAEVEDNDLEIPTEAAGLETADLIDLSGAQRPLILAGSGVYYAGAGPDLVRAAERLRIPVQTPIWDRGVFDRPSDVFCGVVGAATGGPDLIDRADLLILAGVVNDYRVGYLRQGKRVARMLRGWERLGGRPWVEWCAEARAARDNYTARIDLAGRGGGGTHAVDVVDAIRETLPADGVLAIDGGSIGQWAHQLLCDRRYPSHWLTCGRSGVVGYGLAGAMAARLAYPDRAVVLLSGDGAFTFTVAEIECAVRQKLPFVAVVADDRCWGITHSGHLRQFGRGISTELGEIRFDDLARSMGARGERIESPARIAPAIREAIASGEVTVLHVPIVGGNPT
jgi:acetolactate synthase-1/2/3 large subunit